MRPLDVLARPVTRADIEAHIELLIEVLDAMDGDPDLEDDDPAGQCDEDGVNTSTGCDPGEGHDPDEARRMPVLKYGIDQSLGPINEAEAAREWHRARLAKDWEQYPNHLRPREFRTVHS